MPRVWERDRILLMGTGQDEVAGCWLIVLGLRRDWVEGTSL